MNEAAKKAAQAEVLLPTEAGVLEAEHEMERTARMSQRAISQAVDLQTQRKAYNMTLPKFGPYRQCYTSNGKYALLGGSKGHLVVLDWENARIQNEIHVKETVRTTFCAIRRCMPSRSTRIYTFTTARAPSSTV